MIWGLGPPYRREMAAILGKAPALGGGCLSSAWKERWLILPHFAWQMADRYSSISSPDLLKVDARAASPLHLRKSPTWDLVEPSGPPSLSPYSSSPSQLLAPKPTLGRPSSPRPSFFLQSDVDWSPTAPSRPKVMAVPYEGLSGPGAHGGSPRCLRPAGLPERQFDYRPFAATGGWGGRAGSPRLPGESSMSQAFFPERGPSPRPPLPPPYENHSLYPSAPGSFWAQGKCVPDLFGPLIV